MNGAAKGIKTLLGIMLKIKAISSYEIAKRYDK
jgi:hypothetical protein